MNKFNPQSGGVHTLGTLWSSSLFPGRCPSNYNILLNYIGGLRDSTIGSMRDSEIIHRLCRTSCCLCYRSLHICFYLRRLCSSSRRPRYVSIFDRGRCEIQSFQQRNLSFFCDLNMNFILGAHENINHKKT